MFNIGENVHKQRELFRQVAYIISSLIQEGRGATDNTKVYH